MTNFDEMRSESIEQSNQESSPIDTLRNAEGPELSLADAVEFAENQEPRCPCVLLLDTSGSMEGRPIAAS